ncbi:MAG: ClpXP protease specificity-enhancing factor [Burkholderiaceae bacterium]|jgi:stringent starvation protein B|nr:ClpXP protease specificity-enhancing factor [Polynucleobacter sp.]
MSETSTKPYLLRALYEWCTDNGYTPYIVVTVDARTRVPAEFVKNGEIVLNISFDATGNLKMDNDFIHFKARFGGVAREIELPVENVSAIYARENGQGMAFEVKREDQQERKKKPDAKKLQAAKLTTDNDRVQGAPILTSVLASVPRDDDDKPDPDPPKNHGKPKLTRIK